MHTKLNMIVFIYNICSGCSQYNGDKNYL